jgi:hypothetical protein
MAYVFRWWCFPNALLQKIGTANQSFQSLLPSFGHNRRLVGPFHAILNAKAEALDDTVGRCMDAVLVETILDCLGTVYAIDLGHNLICY